MSSKHVYHVLPSEDKSWLVFKEGFRRPHLIGDNKEHAVLLARRLARTNVSGQVIVHGPDDLLARGAMPLVNELIWHSSWQPRLSATTQP